MMLEATVTEPNRGLIPQAGLILGSILAVMLSVIGLIVGFTKHGTSSRGGDVCGSVLGGTSEQLTLTGATLCDRALSAPTTWTVILLVAAAIAFLVGLAITLVKKNAPSASAA